MDNLHAKSIAVVGVSANSEKYGYAIFRDLVNSGLRVFGVNPKGGFIQGRKIYPSLHNLPRVPDLVITVVKPDVTGQIVEECMRLGIKEIWMQPGSESEQAIHKAESAGIRITSNACFMLTNRIWKKEQRRDPQGL